MTTKHTPGPWRQIGGKGCSVAFNIAGDAWSGCEVGGKNKEANARLIASAPELLEALLDLMCALEELTRHPSEWWPREWEAAQAAIAKATREPT